MTYHEIPVATKCVPAEPGTRAILEDGGEWVLGQYVVAWAISIKQSDTGPIWPHNIFMTPVTFDDAYDDIAAVMHPNGMIDSVDGGHFENFDSFKAEVIPAGTRREEADGEAKKASDATDR